MFIAESTTNKIDTPVQLFQPAIFLEQDHIVAYEKIIPKVYEEEYNFIETHQGSFEELFGKVDPCANRNDVHWDNTCLFRKHAIRLLDDLNLNLQEKSMIIGSSVVNKSEVSKKRRGITIFGKTLKWCCDVAITSDMESFLVNEERLKSSVNNVKNAFVKDHKDLVNVEKNFNRYTEKVSEYMKNFTEEYERLSSTKDVSGEIGKIMLYMIELTSKFDSVNTRNRIFDQCREQLLPNHLIDVDRLIRDLKNWNGRLANDGMTLAIGENNAPIYYTLPLAQCAISKKMIAVTLRVPVVKTSSNWKIAEFVPIPFVDNGLVCKINAPATIIAIDRKQKEVRPFTDIATQSCDIHTSKICAIPRRKTHRLAANLCYEKIHNGDDLKVLTKYCEFHCEEREALSTVLTQISPNVFIITNYKKPLRLWNSAKHTWMELKDESHLPGAIKVVLPCEIELYEGEERLIEALFPCEVDQVLEIARIIPNTWASIPVPESSLNDSLTYKNLTEIYKSDWKKDFPVFYTKISDEELDMPEVMLDKIPTSLFELDLTATLLNIFGIAALLLAIAYLLVSNYFLRADVTILYNMSFKTFGDKDLKISKGLKLFKPKPVIFKNSRELDRETNDPIYTTMELRKD